MNKNLIKNKNFLLLTLGKLVSMLGSNMQQFALSLYVLDKTGSATIFASMLSISILPRLLLSPFAGVFGDWFDRKKSIVILDFINAIVIGLFARIFFLQDGFSIPMIYILVILLEITEIFFGSAMSGILPSIVDKDNLLTANSYNSLVMSIGGLLAPVIASLLYSNFGMQTLLIINSLSFLLSAISETFIDMPKTHKRPEKISMESFKVDFIEGLDVIKHNTFIRTMISLAVVLNFCISPLFSVGFTYIIRDYLSISSFKFSLFQTILSLSMLIAPLIVGKLSEKHKSGSLMYKSFIYIGIFIFVSALGTLDSIINMNAQNTLPFIIITAAAFVMGFMVTIANVVLGTIMNNIIPLNMMGRISTVLSLFSTILIPIGQMLFGFMYDRIHPSIVTVIIGLIFLITVIKFKNQLIKYDKIEDDEEIILGGEVIES